MSYIEQFCKLSQYRAQSALRDEKWPLNVLHMEVNMNNRNLVQIAMKWSSKVIENKIKMHLYVICTRDFRYIYIYIFYMI